MNPSPNGADGNPVDMANIFDGIDKGSLTKLKTIIEMKDSNQFAVEYKMLLRRLLLVPQNGWAIVSAPAGSDERYSTYRESRSSSHVATIKGSLALRGGSGRTIKPERHPKVEIE